MNRTILVDNLADLPELPPLRENLSLRRVVNWGAPVTSGQADNVVLAIVSLRSSRGDLPKLLAELAVSLAKVPVVLVAHGTPIAPMAGLAEIIPGSLTPASLARVVMAHVAGPDPGPVHPDPVPAGSVETTTRDKWAVPMLHPDGRHRTLAEIETDIIVRTLADTRGNIALAARRLGIGRSTLYRRLGSD